MFPFNASNQSQSQKRIVFVNVVASPAVEVDQISQLRSQVAKICFRSHAFTLNSAGAKTNPEQKNLRFQHTVFDFQTQSQARLRKNNSGPEALKSHKIHHYKKMGSQSVIAKVTEQRNDLHSWQYPAHARKKKTKVEFRKTQENPRRYFEVKTSNKFVALEASEGLEKHKDHTTNQQNAPK